jgi:hypothetical protein
VAAPSKDGDLAGRSGNGKLLARLQFHSQEAGPVPTKVKLLLTLAVIALGAFCAWLEAIYADALVAKVIAGLTAFLVIALWMFPEAGVKSGEQKPE